MRATLVVLIVCFASIALADDFKTINGKEYKNVTVSRVEPDGVVVTFSGGIVKIPFTELSPEIQKKYGYDAAAAIDFQKQAYEAGVARAREIAEAQTKKQQQQSNLSRAATSSQLRQSGGSAHFKVEPIDARLGAYKLTYKSAEELADKQQAIAQGLMLSEEQRNARISLIPQGGEITLIHRGSDIYSTMTKNLTVIVTDKQGNEILRKTGNDNIPEPSERGWIAAMIVALQQPIDEPVTVYVVNNNSGYREQFRIQREH
jgi:hypothetical protein